MSPELEAEFAKAGFATVTVKQDCKFCGKPMLLRIPAEEPARTPVPPKPVTLCNRIDETPAEKQPQQANWKKALVAILPMVCCNECAASHRLREKIAVASDLVRRTSTILARAKLTKKNVDAVKLKLLEACRLLARVYSEFYQREIKGDELAEILAEKPDKPDMVLAEWRKLLAEQAA